MVNVIYIGDIFPTKVKVIDCDFRIEHTGDIIDVPEKFLEHLLKNKNFILENEEKDSKNKVKKEKVIVKDIVEDVEVEEPIDNEEFNYIGD